MQLKRSQRMLRKTKSLSVNLQFLLDVLLVEGLLALCVYLKDIQDYSLYYYPATVVPVLMWIIYTNSGVYRRFAGHIDSSLGLIWAWSKVVGIMLVWAFVSKASEAYSREVVLTWFVIAAVGQVVLHVLSSCAMHRYFMHNHRAIPSIMVGNGKLAQYLTEKINANPWVSHKIIGSVGGPAYGKQERRKQARRVEGVAYLGEHNDLRALVKKWAVRRVYFALPMHTSHEIREMQIKLLDLNVDIVWAPDIFGLHLLSPSVKEVAGVPLYYLSESPMVDGARFIKVFMDKVCASLALLLLSPLLLGAALAVKLSSPGPVLFRQQRHGLDGKIIDVYKFRSMKLHIEQDHGVTQAVQGDSRITKVGAFLRSSSIDELPQLLNVLKGNMSLVGPRPHAVKHNEFYADKISAYMSRHRILPGITGLAQANGCRGETETIDKMEKRVEYDLAYINNWSIWLDVRIILKTMTNLWSKNVY